MSDGARIIDVTFIDAETGKTFLQLKLPARQLPQSFDAATTLNLGKDDWQVLEATPSSATQFVASGALTLRMRKLQLIDPREILFSLPTVADEIPEPGPPAKSPLLTLHQDDWLQLELVPAEVLVRAEPDLTAIQKVLATERQGPGFKRLHIRKALPDPFANRELRLAELSRRYGPAREIQWSGGQGAVERGFGFTLPNQAILYGQGSADSAFVFGLGVDRLDADLSALRSDARLALIDWCRGVSLTV